MKKNNNEDGTSSSLIDDDSELFQEEKEKGEVTCYNSRSISVSQFICSCTSYFLTKQSVFSLASKVKVWLMPSNSHDQQSQHHHNLIKDQLAMCVCVLILFVASS